MYIGIQNRLRSARFIMDFFCLILCIVVFSAAGACSKNRRIIKNPELDVWDSERMRYKNLFPPSMATLKRPNMTASIFANPTKRGSKNIHFLLTHGVILIEPKAMTRQRIRLPLTFPSLIILSTKFR